MDFKSIVCPISVEKIDSNVSRLTIFFNVVLMGGYLYTLNPIFIGIVSIDYFIRAFLKVKYSPIRFVALQIISALNLEKKTINLAQKVFASRLGVLCAVSSLVLYIMDLHTASLIIAGILMVLSTLDSVFNFCVGCLIYNLFVLPFYKEKV
jgi:hypothetical protein